MLTDIVSSWGVDAEHRSMPQWEKFWTHEDEEADRYVVITRRPDISVLSAYEQGHGNPGLPPDDDGVRRWTHLERRMTVQELGGWWWMAMERLALLPNAHWLSYEALVAHPTQQLMAVAEFLGIEPPVFPMMTPFDIKDGNEKWLARLRY